MEDGATLWGSSFFIFSTHIVFMGVSLIRSQRLLIFCAVTALPFLHLSLEARDKKDAVQYGTGLIVNVPAPEADVLKAVEDVVQNGMIRGTKEYAKDDYLSRATPATESNLFPAWTEGGKVFYKIRLQALDPRNFKESNDVGTVAVRYVVMGQDDKHTVLRIDALFVEDFRHKVHASDGTVEGAEYKDIHDHLEAAQLVKQQTADAERQKQEATQQKFLAENSGAADAPAQPTSNPSAEIAASASATATSTSLSTQELQERVRELRKQTQRKVKAPGAPLKTAPFHTASNLQSLTSGTEVLIVISTPYWYGVETHDGQHGWMMRDELEDVQ